MAVQRNPEIPSTFRTFNPVKFGWGVASETGVECKKLGLNKVLLVYDKGVDAAGLAGKIRDSLKAAGVEYVIYDNVQADPPDWSCDEAAEIGRKENVDGVVAVGGGSSIDTGKAVKCLLDNPGQLRQYLGRGNGPKKPGTHKLVVIPTTAGTGSENTPGGAITDTEKNIKTNIDGVSALSDMGLVDPEMTMGLPPKVTASTGFDVLAHAGEAYTSSMHNPWCDALAEKAIKLVGKYLLRAVNDGKNDPEARCGMMEAATLAGMAMLGPMCHFPHDIGKAIGARFHMPHGNACSMCFPQTMEYIAPACPDRVKFIAEALGAELPADATVEQIGKAAHDVSLKLMKDIKLASYADFGITSLDQLIPMVGEIVVPVDAGAAKVFGGYFAPMPVTQESIDHLVRTSWKEMVEDA